MASRFWFGLLTNLGKLGDCGRCFRLHGLMEFRLWDIRHPKSGFALALTQSGVSCSGLARVKRDGTDLFHLRVLVVLPSPRLYLLQQFPATPDRSSLNTISHFSESIIFGLTGITGQGFGFKLAILYIILCALSR